MRIVHLSDAHFNPKRSSEFINNIVKPLIKDLVKYHKTKPIDLICFTGDLIDKGGGMDAPIAFNLFQKIFIEEILSQLDLPKESFLFIPGNHDVERNKIHNKIEKQLQQELIDKDSINSNMAEPKDLNLERLQSYKSFQDAYYKDIDSFQSDNFGYSLKLKVNEKHIAIAGVNSSWRCSDENDRMRLIVGRKQLNTILKSFEGCEFDIKIALMHHPYDHLIECDKDEIEGLITREFDLLLTGHVHQTGSHFYQNNLGHGTVRSIASSNWDDNVGNDSIIHCNGYTIIDFNEIEKVATLHNRKYSLNKLSYIPNIEISMNEDGTSIFRLPNNEEKKQFNQQSEVIDKIKSNYLPILDEKLLIYNTDTQAPKDLESIFVLPKIEMKQEKLMEDKKAEEKKELDLDFLCTTSDHFLLFGDRESGKSTILYRLLQYAAKTHTENKKIPIYIDLKRADLSTHIINDIVHYLGIRKENVEDYLQNNNVLLLLDNVSFSKKQEKYLNKLLVLLKKNSNLNVVSTAEGLGDGEIPLEFLSQQFFKVCKVATIKHFQSNQIRTLMKKWFGLKENEKLNEQFETIIETFHSLNIPTTPMAVSMFLWIVEKQDSYKPKNNAAMLQNFLEKLLDKHNMVEIRSEDFDYQNQNSLLVHISKKMFESSNINYRLSVLDLKTIIQQHFKEVGWTPKAYGKQPYYDWIPDYFTSVGLFIEDNAEDDTYIKFRLNCFFHYFLMQNIDIDEKFREHVFHEDHFLEFLSEIDYYTALFRDRTDALKRINTLMNETYDSVFEVREFRETYNEHFFDTLFKKEENEKFIDQFNTEKDIDNFISASAVSEEKEDQLNDMLLEDSNSFPQARIKNKEPQIEYSKMKLLEKAWILGARVLKNSEESKDILLKKRAYQDVLENSLTFMGLYYSILIKIKKKNEKRSVTDVSKETVIANEFLEVMMKFIVPAHQMLLFNNLGTSKLDSVFKEYLEDVKNKPNVSNIYKFTALFMYTDLHQEDSKEYLNAMVPHQVRNIVLDFVFTKLRQYESKKLGQEHEYYPDLMKKLVYMKDSQKYHPKRQSNQEETKNKIKKRQFLASVKNKRSSKRKRKKKKDPREIF
ncbi:metallophosphoesterase family protein [Sutcliffiella rhizosphaerae]|uniref:3',5'-cyclic adenosine monophosphate phosphodiesterase CpdA n=1 Tax=Sutcliffiella rhizosphaerae TaxID=2880967 RepID=A0ABN8AC58_9BACI|nr:metallophosphoesterase [Sutcliffiella rhizosphaerae]CAG9622813.1 3',5'-cyclic adenosine monophosphate phosphodiesterase CpdA [Sutcliffiella rhizosphaerae]